MIATRIKSIFVITIILLSLLNFTPTAYAVSNAVPVSVDITDMDTVNNIYSMRKYYTFEAVVSSLTNPCDVETVILTCKQGGAVLFEVEAITLTTVPQWTITVGADIIDLDSANCLWSVVGNQGTATFKIRTEWDFPDDSDLDLYLTAENISGASAETVMQTDYFSVISTLVATMTTGTPSISLNIPVGISGVVRYPTAVGGIIPSLFYPPDAQFTSVALYEGVTLIVTDNGVVNGAYDVVFTPALQLMSHTYTLKLNMKPDFVDATPANNPTLTVKVTNEIPDVWLGIMWGLDGIFLLFGVVPYLGVGPTQYVVNWMSAMSSFFIQSVILMISTVQMLGSIIIGGGGFLLTWGGNVATIVIQVTGIVSGIFSGAGYTINGVLYVFPNGIGNVWTTLGGATTMSLIPVLIIVFWMMSLDGRVLTTGQNHFAIAIGDINVAFGLISIFTYFAMLVYGTIFGIVQWVFGLIGGIFTK